MLTITELGKYSVAGGGDNIVNLYMVDHQGGIQDGRSDAEPQCTYYMDLNGNTELLAWPDWLAFAHAVNKRVGAQVLDIKKDPAVELGIAVANGMECPDCGNRIMDFLCPLDLAQDLPEGVEDEDMLCDHCGAFYIVGP